MRRLTRFFLPILLALPACTNELESGRGKSTLIFAEISSNGSHNEDPLTRTSIDPKIYDNYVTGILWTPGDKLGVFGISTVNAEFTTGISAPVANASFSGALKDGDTPLYAYYPYSAANDGKQASALTGTVAAVQTYNINKGILSDDWKYGSLKSSDSNGYKFSMKHLFVLARVVVDADNTPLTGDTLKSISFKVESSKGSEIRRINGGFSFSAVDGRYSMTDNAVDGVSNVIALSWAADAADGLVLSSGKSLTAYFSLIPDVKSGDKITIVLTTDSHTAKFSVPALVDFWSGYIYTMPLTLTELATKMSAAGYGEPVYAEISSGTDPEPTPDPDPEPTPEPDPTVTTGTFTACAFNVDGLPSIVNSDGPGSDGTTTMANIANGLGWDIIAASEDFEYNSQLVSGLSNYSHGTWRGTVGVGQAFGSVADTDGLNFFWLTSTTSATGETYIRYNDAEGDLYNGANTCIKKGFRHYEVTVADGVVIDVYITHMNTYSGSGNTESNAFVKAVLSQLRQLRDYVLENAKANKRPAVIMGDTNMRYTRHDIKTNFLDVVAAYESNAGYTVSDPWVEFHRGGVYPAWDSKSLMTRFAFAGDKTNDIVCADNQKGEVVDKIWYLNVPGAEVQLKATAHQNDVDNFRKSTSDVSYSGVMVEDANGSSTSGNTKYTSNQTVSYTKDVGYSDHFPVVTTFQWTKTVAGVADL